MVSSIYRLVYLWKRFENMTHYEEAHNVQVFHWKKQGCSLDLWITMVSGIYRLNDFSKKIWKYNPFRTGNNIQCTSLPSSNNDIFWPRWFRPVSLMPWWQWCYSYCPATIKPHRIVWIVLYRVIAGSSNSNIKLGCDLRQFSLLLGYFDLCQSPILPFLHHLIFMWCYCMPGIYIFLVCPCYCCM